MIFQGLMIMLVGLIVVFGFLALIVVFIQITSFFLRLGASANPRKTGETPHNIVAGIIALTYHQDQNLQ